MADGALDRRVRRTKTRLKAALMKLIEERGYEAITIRDLAERADVGRSTFYSHYGSKEDLLFDGFDAWLLSLAEGKPGQDEDAGAAGFRFSRPFLEHARGQKRFFRATIAETPDPRVRRRLVELMTEVVRRELARGSGRSSISSGIPGVSLNPATATDARAHAIVGALHGLLSWWLEEAEWLEPGEIDAVFQRIAGGVVGD